MSENKTIIKNGLLFSIAPFVPKIVSFALLPIMTMYLTDVDFGISGTITAYSQSIGAFATLGLTIVVMNSFFKDPENYRETWRKIYGFLNCWMIFYALCQAVLLYFCIPDEAIEYRWWIIFLTNFSTVFFGPTAIIGNAYYVYTKQSVPVVWRSVAAGVITLLANFVLIVYLNMGYMGWYIGGFIGTFFTNASYWPVVNLSLKIKPTLKFTLSEIKHYLSVSIPTIPHYYTMYMLEGSGRAVLDMNGSSQAEIGRLSISQQMVDIYQTGIAGVNNALQPYFMQSIKDGNSERYKNLSLFYIGIIFVSAFMIALWSKEIFGLMLSNESLASSYPYFILYIMAICYRPMYVVASNYYFFYEKTKQLLMITFASGCISMFIYLLFVPKFGVWAFLVGHYIACLYYGYSGFLFSCYKEHKLCSMPILLIFLLHIVLTAVAYYVVDFLMIKSIISIFAILFGGFCIIKLYKKQ